MVEGFIVALSGVIFLMIGLLWYLNPFSEKEKLDEFEYSSGDRGPYYSAATGPLPARSETEPSAPPP